MDGGLCLAKPASGWLLFGILASLAEFERQVIRERTMAGLTAAPRRAPEASSGVDPR